MLNKGHAIEPETFPSVTVYFSHLEGFDDIIAATRSPAEMTVILNSFYVVCDAVVEAMDVYKVETVGDAYMASFSPRKHIYLSTVCMSFTFSHKICRQFSVNSSDRQRLAGAKWYASRKYHLRNVDYSDGEGSQADLPQQSDVSLRLTYWNQFRFVFYNFKIFFNIFYNIPLFSNICYNSLLFFIIL